MPNLHYDRITTTIEREWLAQIIAGRTTPMTPIGLREWFRSLYCWAHVKLLERGKTTEGWILKKHSASHLRRSFFLTSLFIDSLSAEQLNKLFGFSTGFVGTDRHSGGISWNPGLLRQTA